MNYKDKLELYLQGALSPEETKSVREELDRFEAMEQFLLTRSVLQMPESEEITSSEDPVLETKQIRQQVSGRLRRVVMTAVALSAALFLAAFLLVSPLMDALFYDPGRQSVSDRAKDITYDLYAVSELHKPGFTTSSGQVDPLGFGRYRLNYGYLDTFSAEFYSVEQSIEQGRINQTASDPILRESRFGPIRTYLGEQEIKEDTTRLRDHLTKLNPLTYVSATMYFAEDQTMQQLTELEAAYPDVSFQWAAIRTEEAQTGYNDLIGLHLLDAGVDGSLVGDERINQSYPGFYIMKWLSENPLPSDPGLSPEAAAYEQHFKAILDYTIARSQELSVLHPVLEPEFYEKVRAFTDQQGIKTYGVLVYAEAEDLLLLMDRVSPRQTDINHTLVSRPFY